ncbi:MAG: hypothetical protein KKA84_07870 [Bacteroidetes bacterium]|nr:hypothetical protein [Bacteroidota bacterium]
MNYLDVLKKESGIFWKYFEAKYKLFYNSNLFLRDLQYAIQRYFETKNVYISYSQAETTALEFVKELEKEGDLLRLDAHTWRVNFHIGSDKKEELVEEINE